MWKFFSQAYQDTRANLGWSWTVWIISFVGSGGLAILYYWLEGKDRAMNEVWTFLYGCLVFVVAVFVPTFLYNLWLAPYRLIEKRLDKELSGSKRAVSGSPKEPQPANVALYQNHKTLSLYEAACLWVEIEPHDPITDQGAAAKLSFLKGAVRNDELICAWRSSWTRIYDIVHGIKDKTPTDYQEVSVVKLRQYAEKTGGVPLFLRHVSLPLESSKKEGAQKQSTSSTD